MKDKAKKKSKYLSLILRHRPDLIGIKLDEAGWVKIDILLKAIKANGDKSWSREILEEVVRNNDKKRFSISEDGKRIRANQGHSVDIKLGYEPTEPPSCLFHGTVGKVLDSIWDNGLQKMKRHHVHLSADIETAKKVGSRRGSPIVLMIDATRMYEDGHEFYLSDNGVWLVDHVPSQYFSIV
jgi:putative RNA 2'-phosphotransferase